MMFTRYVSAISSGTVMTLGLIYVMQFLISMNIGTAPDPGPRIVVDWVKVRKVDPVRTRDFTPPPIEELTRTELPPQRIDPKYQGPVVGVSLLPPEVGQPGPATGLRPISDNPLVAIVRVQPVYPAALQARGVEGHVIVEYDVLANGSVANVVVIETTHSGFNNAAIKAAERFKYKARVVDGVPLVTTGIRSQFTFEIEN